MLDVMSQVKDAIEAYSTRLRAISSNITNLQVTGYKRSDVAFETIYSKLISQGTSGVSSDGEGGTNPMQIAGSVGISGTSVDFRQGDIASGSNLDLAINGDGLFAVSPDDGQTMLYTRNGEFQIVDNKLVTKSGMQVYGIRGNNGSLEPIDISGLNVPSNTDLTFDQTGNLVTWYDQTSGTYGDKLPFKIALVNFNNPSGLQYADNSAFAETAASGNASAAFAPESGGINRASKESSNVVYTSELVDSMEIQRAMSSVQTVLKLMNDTISSFISKLG